MNRAHTVVQMRRSPELMAKWGHLLPPEPPQSPSLWLPDDEPDDLPARLTLRQAAIFIVCAAVGCWAVGWCVGVTFCWLIGEW